MSPKFVSDGFEDSHPLRCEPTLNWSDFGSDTGNSIADSLVVEKKVNELRNLYQCSQHSPFTFPAPGKHQSPLYRTGTRP